MSEKSPIGLQNMWSMNIIKKNYFYVNFQQNNKYLKIRQISVKRKKERKILTVWFPIARNRACNYTVTAGRRWFVFYRRPGSDIIHLIHVMGDPIPMMRCDSSFQPPRRNTHFMFQPLTKKLQYPHDQNLVY